MFIINQNNNQHDGHIFYRLAKHDRKPQHAVA